MEDEVVEVRPGVPQRQIKFPQTRRGRFECTGRLHEIPVSGPLQAQRIPPGGPYIYNGAGPMGPYPMPPVQMDSLPLQHNVTWADRPSSSSGDGETVTDDSSEENEGHPPQPQLQGNNNDKTPTEKMAALAGTTMPSSRVPQVDTPANCAPRPWMQIAKADDDDDGPPVLGPPGRTPPPVRKNFKFPEELEEDDEVFFDETVPEVVFNDEIHHPAYGQYIPGQYQHTLNYLYGLHTIQEADESMLNQETFKEKASSWDIFVVILTLLGYLVNVGSDIWLAYEYLVLKHYLWFAMTLAFIVLPAIAMTVFSLVLYVQDIKVLDMRVSKLRWVIRSIFLVLLIAPVMRIIDTLHYGLKSRRCEDWRMRRRNLEQMRDEDTDSGLVRLFETFLENAPQLVLQLYVVVRIGNTEGSFLVAIQVLCLISSITTMAWSLVSYQASLRSSLPDKAEMTWPGKLCMFVWRLMTIAARVIALAMFASHFEVYIFAVIGGHFVLMFVWVVQQKTMYCMIQVRDDAGLLTKDHHSACLEFCFRAMAAFVYIFCFFNLLEGHTRLRCLVYYTLVYMENTVLILTWNILASTLGDGGWYAMPAVTMVMGGFFIGILFQMIYYLWCHPNKTSRLHRHKKIRLWVPCAELSLFHQVVVAGEAERAEQNPVFGEGEGRPGGAEMHPVRPTPAPRSDFGGTVASSSIGPIMPMETSTPAPSMVGVSPPHRTGPVPPVPAQADDLSPLSCDTATTAMTLTDTSHSAGPALPGPTLPIPTIPSAQPTQDRVKPVPAPRQPRPTTPACELEPTPRSRPTTPARDLEIRGEFELKTPEPTEGDKFETEV